MTVAELQAQIERQAAQIDSLTAPRSIADSNEVAKAWVRWDSLYQMLGERTPQALPGEKPQAYLRRLAGGVRKYTDSFRSYAFHDSQQAMDLTLVSDKIFAEAMANAKKPRHSPAGFIRDLVTTEYGKTRTEFVGDHRAPWLPFTHPTKFALTRINRPQ